MVLELSDSLKHLKNQIQDLSSLREWEKEVLEKRLEQASDTIANQTSMIEGFGTFYTIVGILIAAIGLILPAITYVLGIRPSQKALQEFEQNADKKIENFLSKKRNKQIEQAISDLKSDNPVERQLPCGTFA